MTAAGRDGAGVPDLVVTEAGGPGIGPAAEHHDCADGVGEADGHHQRHRADRHVLTMAGLATMTAQPSTAVGGVLAVDVLEDHAGGGADPDYETSGKAHRSGKASTHSGVYVLAMTTRFGGDQVGLSGPPRSYMRVI